MHGQRIAEVGYIYYLRNELARERDRLRHKYNYLKDIKRSIRYQNPSEDREVMQARRMIARALQNIGDQRPSTDTINNQWISALNDAEKALDNRLQKLEMLATNNPIPKKWLKVSKSELNLMILEAEAALAQAKADIMRHTKKYSHRLKMLGKEVQFSPQYSCGVVRGLTTRNGFISQSDMKNMHDEYLADLAIEKMLTEEL